MTDWEEAWLLEEKYAGVRTPEFERDKERLKAGEPLSYVIGFVDFLGCHIDLSHRPLIPRPETEHWVSRTIDTLRARNTQRPLRCLDLFTGSGCIGLAVLNHIPNAVVDFADSDPAAIEQVRTNLEKNGIASDRARVIQSDIFENIHGRYDYIFANPPYIAENNKDRVQESVGQWEPTRALWGGEDGLKHVRRFLGEAFQYLTPDGVLIMEFDDTQKEAIAEFCARKTPFDLRFFDDQYGLPRFLEARIQKH